MKFFIIFCNVLLITILSSKSFASGEVNVYSYRQPILIDPFFEEFTNQSFLGRNNSRFHIISKIDINGNWIDVDTNNSNDGIF